MNKKVYSDMDSKTYYSLKRILDYDKKRFILLSKKRRNILVEELDKIQDVDNIRLIKYLLVLCFDKDFIVASKALNHLKRIVDNLTIKELLFFTEYFRSSYYYYSIDCEIEKSYSETNKYRFDLINRFGKESRYILSVLTLHPNGYIREDALKKLSEMEDGFKIKFIMIRVNDWVKEIRILAKKELIKCIKDEYLKDIVECLPIIDRMNNWGRDNYSDILFKLEDFIIKQRNYDLLLDSYKNSEERLVKRKLFKYLLEINTTVNLIINIGLKSKDIIILRTTIKKIDEIVNKDNIELIFKALKQNKNVTCKIAAIDILEKMSVPDIDKVLIPFIYSKSYKLRDYARYKLNKKEIKNFREMYLDEINENNYNLYGIISGIKETGIHEDVKCILKYINHENVKIRKLVLSTVYNLNSNEGIRYTLDKLISDNISESNNARRCLENDIVSVDENIIFELFEFERYEDHVYMNIIKLINKYSKWSAITNLLRVLKISSSTYIPIINDEIELWINKFNRSFISPRKEQVEYISKLYMMTYNKLSSNNSFQIGDILKK
ncbi:MAG: hypothetical protein N4A63_01575 [Vallitalea sp.]|jgi:hypothetical protein|nr:hypothetical protein [Vallitalea sp.]